MIEKGTTNAWIYMHPSIEVSSMLCSNDSKQNSKPHTVEKAVRYLELNEFLYKNDEEIRE